MLEPDPNRFYVYYPAFVALSTKLKQQPEFVSLLSGHFAVPVSHRDGKKMMAIFTDHDLAERFAAAAQIPDGVAVTIGSH